MGICAQSRRGSEVSNPRQRDWRGYRRLRRQDRQAEGDDLGVDRHYRNGPASVKAAYHRGSHRVGGGAVIADFKALLIAAVQSS